MSDNPKEDNDEKAVSQMTEEAATDTFTYSDYFVSKEAFLIFVLLHVDGEQRAKLLGITEEMYESIAKAKEWRNSLINVIHSDRCKHLSADEAASKLNEIYSRMEKNAD